MSQPSLHHRQDEQPQELLEALREFMGLPTHAMESKAHRVAQA
jgi:hypothetical protein